VNIEDTQVFTPPIIIDRMFQEGGFNPKIMDGGRILEPSFGNGEILLKIVSSFIKYAKKQEVPVLTISQKLNKSLYGAELDSCLYNEAIERLKKLTYKELGIEIWWKNLHNTDSLTFFSDKKYKNYFDYIIGNPPYQRVKMDKLERYKHIYPEKVKGVVDIYMLFIHLSLNLVKENGVVTLITPRSYIYNKGDYKLKERIEKEKALFKVLLLDFDVFSGISSSVAISVFKKNSNSPIITKIEDLKGEERLVNVLPIFAQKNTSMAKFKVKTGISTNANNVYIGKVLKTDKELSLVEFKNGNYWIENSLLKKAYKGSKLKSTEVILFPYFQKENKFIVIPARDLSKKYPKTFSYFLKNKDILEKRNGKFKEWYEYARSQAINDTSLRKIIIKDYIAPDDTMIGHKIIEESTLVYSGLYIPIYDKVRVEDIISFLEKPQTVELLRNIGNRISGNYTRFGSAHFNRVVDLLN